MVKPNARDKEQQMAKEANAETGATPPAPEGVEQIELSEEAARFVEELKHELDEAVSARQRALADFANYQRRAVENESRARKGGVAQVVRAIIPVLDHFDLALNQDIAAITTSQLMHGVKIVRDELNKALEQQGVTAIRPAKGDEFNPQMHEAMMNQPAPGMVPGSVVSVLQPGYAMGEMMLRPAKVIVASAE